MTTSEFEVEVTEQDALKFAELSGDWNPLHTDSKYAAHTSYRRKILHGAYAAGLLSRMAGMYIPGRDCLLHNIKLKFVAPILPPARLRVLGSIVRDNGDSGAVKVEISDATSGVFYVDGSYEFGRHRHELAQQETSKTARVTEDSPVLVTGATGALGKALLARLGSKGVGLSRSGEAGALKVTDFEQLPDLLSGRKISGIVHCGWPAPDNQRLTALGSDTDAAVQYQVAKPLGDCIKLAQTLSELGDQGATMILVGSTAADAGRHNWRMPLYSVGKSILPTLVKVLALELGARNQRCLGVVLDVMDGGMNGSMRDAVRMAHADRSPYGLVPSPDDVADQVAWVLTNKSYMVSGSLITLSGGALP